MSDDHALTRWWAALDQRQRDEASGLQEGQPMPPWMVKSLVDAGLPATGVWWVEHDRGPEFSVSREVADFLAGESRDVCRHCGRSRQRQTYQGNGSAGGSYAGSRMVCPAGCAEP